MMWLKRNLLALVIGLLFVGLIAFSVLLLQKVRTQQKDSEGRLQSLQQQLDEQMKNTIFPSPKNKEILENQRKQLQEFFHKVYSALPKVDREYPPMPPWEFKGYLETQLQKLEQFCRTNQVMVPTGMTFGFGRYVGPKEPPRKEDTSALLHQLDLTERLLKLLVQAKVVEINSVRRTFLESEGEGARDERADAGQWKKDASLLYESQNFEVTIRCSNDQLKLVLANLATSTNLLTVVRYIGVDMPKTFPATPIDASTTGTAAPATQPPAAMPLYTPGMPPTAVPPGGRAGGGRGGQPTQPGRTAANVPAEVPLALGIELATVNLRLDVIEVRALDENDDPISGEKEAPKTGKKG